MTRVATAGRQVLLFLDNAGVHSSNDDIKLQSTRLVFFSKNTTSCTQPCDAGIIQAFKLKYRKHLHNYILNQIVTENDDPCKSISIAQVIVLAFRAWRDVEPRTISRCFAKAGFKEAEGIADKPESVALDISSEEAEVMKLEINDKQLFPLPIEPEKLFDLVFSKVEASIAKPDSLQPEITEQVDEAEEEETAVIPTSKDAIRAKPESHRCPAFRVFTVLVFEIKSQGEFFSSTLVSQSTTFKQFCIFNISIFEMVYPNLLKHILRFVLS